MKNKRLLGLALSMIGLLAISFGTTSPALAVAVPPSGPRPAELQAAPQSINDLIEGGAKYDGQTVTIEGEVIGDIMRRGEQTWINIHDGPFTSIGIWGSSRLFRGIASTGTYKRKGDVVRVTGAFRREDPSQGGEMDIEAMAVEVTSRGGRVSHSVAPGRAALAIVSVLVAGFLGLMYLRTSKANRPIRG